MRIDRIREAELKQRKGSSIRMIIQLVWLGISGVIAYFLSSYIINNTDLTLAFFRNNFFIPPTIPDWVIHAAFVVILVFLMQAIFFVGYAFGSPEGRVKTGRPRADSRNPDPFDEDRPY
jgi:hypothetical protein